MSNRGVERKNFPCKTTQFGQPNGNPICPQGSAGVAQREFYKWALTQATEEELQAYLNEPKKPYFRKRLIMAIKESRKVSDYCELTNQIYGLPKQTIDVQNLPPIECKVFGD